jgi:hypothetical protein
MLKLDRRTFIAGSGTIAVLGPTGIAAASPIKIGFVISTRVHGDHILSFLQALADNQFTIDENNVQFLPGSAHGRYGAAHQYLYNHAKDHINSGVNLIVAAGGLVSAVAVAKAINDYNADHNTAPTTTRFVYLIGRTPTPADSNYSAVSVFVTSTAKVAGIDQNVVAQNQANYAQLARRPINATKVGLVVNSNNPMTTAEIHDWTTLNQHSLYYQAVGIENHDQLPAIFSHIKAAGTAIDGLVVSCDPYFRSRAEEFDKMLRDPGGGNFSGAVCYPFQEYLNNAVSSNSYRSNSMPFLSTDHNGKYSNDSSYYRLGVVTANYLKNGTNTYTHWDGSKWVT